MSNLQQAILQLAHEEKLQRHDGLLLGSRATPAQQEFIQAALNREALVLNCRAGNRCLAKGTLVATQNGPVPIENIQVGDEVFGPDGAPIKVKAVFQNGPREVIDLTYRGKVVATATRNHVWRFGVFSVENGAFKGYREESFDTEKPDGWSVQKIVARAKLGTHKPFAPYALGALLGDGCSRQYSPTGLFISGMSGVPEAAAADMGAAARKLHTSNYTWKIETTRVPDFYEEWCYERYAHEKIADIGELCKWDRDSLLQFIAGLIDTDGCTTADTRTGGSITFSLAMQARSVIDSFIWAVQALWAITLSLKEDRRAKYKNGSVWTAMTRNPHEIKTILEELDPFLISPQKKWKTEYNQLGKRTRPGFLRISPNFTSARIEETYDIHVDSPDNLYVLANGLVTHNSGKSLTLMKIFAVMFREDPLDKWKRPDHWVGPLQLILLSRQLKQAEESLLPKLLAHLEPDSYRVVRSGNALNKIVNLKNGNTILVFSHHAAEQARAAVQSFDAHFAAIDELPSDPRLIEETVQRVFVQKGCVALTYTPKVPAPRVKEFIDNLPPEKVKHVRLSVLDNPKMDAETKETILSTARAQGEAHLATVLYGEWARGENSVFTYDPDLHKAQLPEHYNPQAWRHILSADPASASETGLVVAAEDPLSPGQWYLVYASYVQQGLEGQELVREIERRVASMRIVRRIYDSAATWFELSARAVGVTYMPVMNKSNRKLELIANLNSALGRVDKPGQRRVLLTNACADLEEELFSASWSATSAEKIAHAHEYHTADATQYLVDLLPPPEANSGRAVATTAQARMMEHSRVQAGVVDAPRQKMTVARRSRAWLR